ncbi:MAG: T9SS type A sorting domain-containing protein [Flavobacterium sp.]
MPPTVLRPGCALPDNLNNGGPLNTTACNNAIKYVGSTTIPVYTPTCYETGSSLSHFEDLLFPSCTSHYANDNYFVVSNVLPLGVTKRYLRPEERKVLCDIGYGVKTTFGSSTTSSGYYNYGGTACGGITVAGLNDGISGGNYTFNGIITTTGGTSTNVTITGLLANDVNATSFECLEEITAPSTTTLSATSGTNSTDITFSTTSPGVHLLRYVPVNGSQRGNITYVLVYIVPPPVSGGCSPTPNACDLVMNGDFEQYSSLPNNLYDIQKACGWGSVNPLTNSSVWPSYFNTFSPHFGCGIPCNTFGAQNCNNGVGNGYAHIWYTTGIGGKQHLYTTLKSPLLPNTAYQLSFDVSLGDGNPLYVSNLQACLSRSTTTPPTILPLTANGDVNISNTSTSTNTLLISPTLIRNVNGWDKITFNFTTTTGGEQFLYLGLLNNSNIVLSPTTPDNLGCSFTPIPGDEIRQVTGYYIDNVSLIQTGGGVLDLPATICSNQTIPDLKTYLAGLPANGSFSGNGVVFSGGVYSFNGASLTSSIIGYTYTNSSGCSVTVYDTINVTAALLPTFSFSTSICVGTIPKGLPSTSSNGFTGTWNPSSIDNTVSRDYTFTPTEGQCSSPVVVHVTITPLQTVTVTPSTQTVCLNAAPIPLQANSTTTGLLYQWYRNTSNTNTGGNLITGATTSSYVPSTGNVGTRYYYVVVTSLSGCVVNSPVMTVTVISGTADAGSLSGNQTLCKMGRANPTTLLTASVAGGTWSVSNPAISSIVSTTSTTATIRVGVGTTTVTYTVVGASGCASSVSMTITTLTPTAPTFSQFPINPETEAPDPVILCAGATPPLLPMTSSNGISGKWVSSSISNTTSGEYVFTPTAGQCAAGFAISVIVLRPTDFVTYNDYYDVAYPVNSVVTASVFDNDTYNGNPFDYIPFNLSYSAIPIGTPPTFPSGGIALNANGTYTIQPNTTPGTYNLSYRITTSCGMSNVSTTTIKINNYVVHPGKIAFGLCYKGPTSYTYNSANSTTQWTSLFDLATVGGLPANSTNAVINVTSPPVGFTLLANGTFTYASSTLTELMFYYTICSTATSFCSDPILCHIIIGTTVQAMDDSVVFNKNGSGTLSINVLNNDMKYDCPTAWIQANTGNVSVTQLAPFNSYFSINSAGIIFPNTLAPIGTYTLQYQICDLTYPTVCRTANVTVYQTNNTSKINQDLRGFDLGSLTVAPNPSKDKFEIVFDSILPNDAHFEVYDVLGKKVLEESMAKGTSMGILNLGNHPQGVYLLRIAVDDAVISKTLLKQ